MSKKIIVTGASRGIGKAISQRLLAKGHKILGFGRHFEWADPALESISLDLSDLDAVSTFLKEVKWEEIDALVCSAGRGKFGHLEQFSLKEIRALLDINFLSIVLFVKHCLPHFKKRQKGDIILIGSEAALYGKKQGSIYSATKFALRGFTQALREECARDHIRISLINPGMVETDFFKDLSFTPGSEPFESIKPEDVAETVEMVLHSRYGTVFDEINLSPQKKRIVFK